MTAPEGAPSQKAVDGPAAAEEPLRPSAVHQPLLVDMMRAASKKAHSVSDALVNRKLAVAITDPKLYGAALSSFWPVFRSIEAKLDSNAGHPSIKRMSKTLKLIRRTERLEADLDYLLGPDWKAAYQQPATVTAYLTHLDALEAEEPALLLVFAYHMHMATGAGGAMIRKMARRAMPDMPPDKGTAVFEFDKGVSLRDVKADYKAGMNCLPGELGERFVARVLEESVKLFQLNNSVVAGFKPSALSYIRGLYVMIPDSAAAVLAAVFFALLIGITARVATTMAEHYAQREEMQAASSTQ